MKKSIFLLFLAFSIGASAQTEPANYAIAIGKITTFYNNNKPDSIYKMFGPPMTGALTPEVWKSTFSQLKAQLGTLGQSTFMEFKTPVATYKSAFQNGPLMTTLVLDDKNMIIGLAFRPVEQAQPSIEAAMDPSLAESPISIKTTTGVINGTLTMPKNVTDKVPVVLIIAGSGPTDRNGNSLQLKLKTNAYREIAEGLGKNGIASVRYDKRMVGASVSANSKESDLRFSDYIDDAVGWIQLLADDQRFSKVIVLGHSEGSLVGMIASRDQPVKGYISVAGAGDKADKILMEQMKSKPQTQQDNLKRVLDSLKKRKTTDNVDASIWYIARPSIQNYLMEWIFYDPQRIIHLLKMPTLIIQGTTDLQVTVADADKLKKGKSDSQLIIIPNMNHVLKEAPADRDLNLATYEKGDLPLKAELIPDIVKFINGVN